MGFAVSMWWGVNLMHTFGEGTVPGWRLAREEQMPSGLAQVIIISLRHFTEALQAGIALLQHSAPNFACVKIAKVCAVLQKAAFSFLSGKSPALPRAKGLWCAS